MALLLYKNKSHVFRLTCANGSSFLIQSTSDAEISSWVQAFTAAVYAALEQQIEKTKDELEGLQKWRNAMLLQFQEKGGVLTVMNTQAN